MLDQRAINVVLDNSSNDINWYHVFWDVAVVRHFICPTTYLFTNWSLSFYHLNQNADPLPFCYAERLLEQQKNINSTIDW